MNNDRYKSKYGSWAGKPQGTPPDHTKCAKEVWPSSTWTSCQCSRKRGHGPDEAYCKQHAKKAKE